MTVVAYGKVECLTKVATLASTAVSVKLGSTSYSCANTDATKCLYSTSATMPSVSSTSVVSNYISFTGANLITSNSFTG